MMAYQSLAFETTVLLLDAGQLPVVGAQPADVSLKIRKYGQASFISMGALTASMWFELGNGFYVLRLPATTMNTTGSFFYMLSGATFAPIYSEVFVTPQPFPSVRPGRCVITGTIADLTGEPVILGPKVVFRLIGAPYAIDGVLIQGGHYETHADAYGNFSVSMVQGVQAMVEIDQLGIKHQITIPDQETARLVDLLPPLV